jgi:hypothetical protein
MMFDEAKPWYFSRTIWASVVVVASVGAGLLGLPIEDTDSSDLTEAALQAVTAIAALVAIIGRIAARARIE